MALRQVAELALPMLRPVLMDLAAEAIITATRTTLGALQDRRGTEPISVTILRASLHTSECPEALGS